jgi:hypothetical protein
MSIRRNVLALALALVATLAIAGATKLGMSSANAASTVCGSECFSLFSAEHGTPGQPNVVETVLDGVAKVGQPVILKAASNSDPSQDIVVNQAGPVSAFYAAGLVSAEVNEHYGELFAAMIEYAPFGNRTGLCVGLAKTAFQGEGLTLQPCTVGARTVWIINPLVSPDARYVTVISGSTTDFARPFAMHYARDEYATDVRLQEIQVRRLQFLGDEKTLPNRQLWGLHEGVVP